MGVMGLVGTVLGLEGLEREPGGARINGYNRGASMKRWVVATAVLLGCGAQGPPGEQGLKGDPGTMGAKGDPGGPGSIPAFDLSSPPGSDLAGFVPPQAINCLPGKAFCVGSQIFVCTLSGADAHFSYDCDAQSGSTPTNVLSCSKDPACPAYNNGACCKRQKVPCSWAFSEPAINGVPINGSASIIVGGPGLTCGQPAPCNIGTFTASVSGVEGDQTACPSTAQYMSFSFNFARTALSVGQTVTLPLAGANVSFLGRGRSCSSWSGTLHFDSDVPSWSVTANLTCTTSGNTDIKMVGTMSGNE